MKQFRQVLTHLFCIHIIALALMSFMRVVFFFSIKNGLTPDVAGHYDLYGKAFLRGLWFDNVAACYVMAVPLVLCSLVCLANLWRKWMWRAVNIWFGTLYALTFMAVAANIPYFQYFTKIINASIWNWAEYGGTTLGLIFGEASYLPFIALYFAVTILFCTCLWLLRRRAIRKEDSASRPAPLRNRTIGQWIGMTVTFAVLAGACLLGIRGRLGYNPIKVSAAYFCTSPVLNNLGVNPAFNLIRSSLDELRPENKLLHLMPEAEAISNVQRFYGRKGMEGISPIARRVTPDSAATRHNVVVVLMESMSAKLMQHFGNNEHLTPHLDSLFAHSLSFENFYSAGNHTNHGLYATLYSFPSIMFRNAMRSAKTTTYCGLAGTLQQAGYSTMFFMTHESQYDNMNAFFLTNGYDEIYSQENYPADKIVNHFGVPDDYLFTYALPVLRRHAASGRPFFATLLTISNHPPYIVPERFRDPKLSQDKQIVRYADDCIGQFMKAVRQEPWAANTIFVFLGDHGKQWGTADCELPESFNHIPLIISGPGIRPEIRTDFAGQVDVAPTVLGLLRIPYVQNNFGIDLMRESRPAAFYTADKMIAARDNRHLYVYNAETHQEFCYDLTDGHTPRPTSMSAKFAGLRTYVFSLLQCTEYMVQNGMTTNRPQTK